LDVFSFYSYHIVVSYPLFLYKLVIVILSFSYFCLLIGLPSYTKNFFYEIILIMLLALWGMLLLLSSNSFIFFFSALELQSLSLYLLAASSRTSIYSVEASFKYFILGAVSSCLMLFAFSLIYFTLGLSSFSDLHYWFASLIDFSYVLNTSWLFMAAFLITIAFLFKLAIAPFHNWSPDLYDGVPLYLTAFFVLFPKLSIAGVFYYVYTTFLSFFDIINLFFLVIGTFSCVFGAVAAIAQKRIKRLIAYSGISNFGFLILALACGTTGIFSYLSFSFIYAFLSLNLFAILFFLVSFQTYEVNNLAELTSFYKTAPLLSFLLALNFFSNAAVPPLAGFFSKFFVLLSLVEMNLYFFIIIILLTTIVSAFYYIRVVKTLFFVKTSANTVYTVEILPSSILLLFSLANVFFVLFLPFFSFLLFF